MAHVYALFSGRDGKVRYVGQTTGHYLDRFEQHKRDVDTRVHDWFESEWKHGYPIECVLLQSCEDNERHQAETQWMNKFRNLINERKWSPGTTRYFWIIRGREFRAPETTPEIAKISAYMRRYRFNVEGFRGVHYDHHFDRYFVLICSGVRSYWLVGDESPITGGNIWFSDLAAAVKARDAHRKTHRVMWLPDYEMEEK